MPDPKIRSVLAATDLEPASDEVVRSAAVLAERLKAGLHLVHAFELQRLPYLEHPTYPERLRQAEEALSEQARRVAPSVRPASLRVVDFAASRAIEESAAEVSADVIVLGPHRGGEAGAHFLGTTADRVIRTAEVPVLVVRGGGLALPVRRIGVPSDLSEPSRGALDLALALASGIGGAETEVVVFHVGWFVERDEEGGLEREKLRPALEQEVGAAGERAGGAPGAAVRVDVVWGVSPAEEIRRYAREHDLGLVVMGTHGYGGLRRVLIGSVASGVARQAPCPVLLVPPRTGE